MPALMNTTPAAALAPMPVAMPTPKPAPAPHVQHHATHRIWSQEEFNVLHSCDDAFNAIADVEMLARSTKLAAAFGHGLLGSVPRLAIKLRAGLEHAGGRERDAPGSGAALAQHAPRPSITADDALRTVFDVLDDGTEGERAGARGFRRGGAAGKAAGVAGAGVATGAASGKAAGVAGGVGAGVAAGVVPGRAGTGLPPLDEIIGLDYPTVAPAQAGQQHTSQHHQQPPAAADGTDLGGSGMGEVSAWLEGLRLGIYAPALSEQGYDDLAYLRGLSEARLRAIAAAAAMKPGHAHKFVDALLGGIAQHRAARGADTHTGEGGAVQPYTQA